MRLKNVKGANEIIIKGKYYINNPEEYKGRWNKLFKNNNIIKIEIGMGKGDFIIENAIKHPNINFIGIEKYDSVIVRAIQKSNELELNNLKIIRLDAINIDKIFDKEIDTIYLNFSDPWPKDRHAKRRLTSPIFLKKYESIFKKDYKIIMKTDNINLFNYSIEKLKEEKYQIIYQTNDLHKENDTFKQQHPNFEELAKIYGKDVVAKVTPYSNQMTEAIINSLSEQGYNLVIEGTGRTTDVPIKTATMLKTKGYQTKMYVMAVPKIKSYLGTIERYEDMFKRNPLTARATPKQAHDIVVSNLPSNLETLHKTGVFSDIRLYDRQGMKLYSSLETPSVSPKEPLESILNKKVSGKEIQSTLERVEEKMVQNKHQDTPEFQAIRQKLDSFKPPIPPLPKLPGIGL